MLKLINKKIVAILLLILIILSNIIPILPSIKSLAVNNHHIGENVNITSIGTVAYHLKSHNVSKGSYVITHLAGYYDNGTFYPAYCMQRDRDGAGATALPSYDVTITDILANTELYNKVWRVVTNGYPYTNLGFSDWTYAYQATKMAVYCVIGQADVNEFYASDDIGNNIITAIKNLVNIGITGTGTYTSSILHIFSKGDIITEGDYFIQNYNLDSNIAITGYDIAISNFPEGTKITNQYGQEKSVFDVSETFQIRVPKTALINGDVLGTIRATVNAKSYAVFYGTSSNTNWQDYTLTADPITLPSNTTKLNIKGNTGSVKVLKTDKETSEPIEGVTFQLQSKDGAVILNATTDEKGEALFSNLYQGNYILKEISTNENYVLNNVDFDVNVEFDKTTSVEVENEHKKGSIKIYKVDKDNNQIRLGNVEFQLYSEEFKKVIGTYYTDVNGELKIDNLRTGNYKLIETKTNKWYNLAEDTEIKVEWDKETVKDVENELKKGQVRVIKVDKDNNEIKLKGVEFEIMDANNNVLEKIVTNENGEAFTQKYPIRDFSSLKIRESKTLKDYVLSDETKTVILKEDQIESVKFENELKKGQVRVVKIDFDNNEIPIPGVEFKVYDENGNVVDTLVTDENGEAISKRLPINQIYTVKETKTNEFYVLTETPKTIVLEQDKVKDLKFTNELKKGQIKVIKVDEDNHEIKLEGVTFDVLDENKNVVDTLITNANGEAITKMLPINQKYTVIEKNTRKEYVLTKETQTVELKQDEITTITFENKKIHGYVEITKIDSKTKETLEGAEFGIYNEKDEQVGTLITDETGKAKSELPYGKYYLKELNTGSVYYLLNENTYEFEIVKDGETVEKTIENEPVDITVDVDKTGTVEIKPGDKVDYTFSNVANNSNIYLEDFKWFDYIPTDYIRLETMTTGTWNQDLTYNVYYKTNKSEDYILFKENLSTNENYNLNFTTIEFAEDEYITETCFDFGKVETGFREITSPTMQCKSFDTLKNGQTFTNYTETVGIYFGVTAKANSDHTTIVHTPKEHEPVLPKTGK